MTMAAFDRLAAARDLEAAGTERRQAEAIASAIGNASDRAATRTDLEPLATKADLEVTKADLKAGLASLEARFYRALWIQGGAIVAAIAALAGIAFALAGLIAGTGQPAP